LIYLENLVSDRKLSYQDLMEIIKLVEESSQFQDFRLKYDNVEIELSKTGPRAVAPTSASAPASSTPSSAGVPPVPATPASAPSAVAPPASAPAEIPAGLIAVRAPMVGTFYRAPEPGAKPFIEEGSNVTQDSVVCILEVMKLMNSLTADVEGVVTKILVADGQTVEYGQPLVLITPKH
jgi:acetyl-CoA carboxylase biotin carboxyl carrier protein